MEEILCLFSFYSLEISMSAQDSCSIREIVRLGIYKVTRCGRFYSLDIHRPVIYSGPLNSDCDLTMTGKNITRGDNEDSIRHVPERRRHRSH